MPATRCHSIAVLPGMQCSRRRDEFPVEWWLTVGVRW